MAESKNIKSDKPRQILSIIFACVAIGAAVATFLLSPAGRRLTSKDDTTIPPITWETMESTIETIPPVTETEAQNQVETPVINSESSSISIPQPTSPTTDPYKNYTFFIDKSVFDSTVNEGVTTLTVKGNEKVKMTVTPLREVSYSQLCENTKKSHAPLTDKEILKIESLNSCYRSQTGDMDEDIVTTVYCIDDGNGGSIEIKYQYPNSAKDYENNFDILLSMFKVL